MKEIGFVVATITSLLLATMAMAYQAASPVEQTGTASVGVNEYIDFTIADLGDSGIGFGDLNPGTTDSAASPNPAVNLTVGSATNVDIHIYMKGMDFSDGTHTLTLVNADVQYDDDATLDQVSETGLTQGTLGTNYQASPGWTTISAPAGGAAVSKNVYHWITVPTGQYAGNYISTLTYKAATS